MVRNLPANAGRCMRHESHSWVGKIPWRRIPIPVFLPGESHGLRSLAGYSPWNCKELDTTEVTEHTQNVESHGQRSLVSYGP